jgi:hypothetical protein
MNLVNIFNEGYNSILKTLGASKPAAPAAPAAPPAPAVEKAKAHTFETNDSTKTKESKLGKAYTAPLDICSMENTIEQWIDNRVPKDGSIKKGVTKVEIPADVKGLSVINHLCGPYAEKKGYTHDQKVNVQHFLKEIQAKSDKLENPLLRNNILHILADAVKERGISDQQMSMIADGQFNAEAYIAMVNQTGEPIA